MKLMAVTILGCFAAVAVANAAEKPPNSPKRQRTWLITRLLAYMLQVCLYAPGRFFERDEGPRAKAIANQDAAPWYKISNKDLDALCNYYYCTRARAETDIRESQRVLANGQPQAPTDEEVKAAKDDREKIAQIGGQLAGRDAAVKRLGNLIYASLPGFCYRQSNWLPNAYFRQIQVQDQDVPAARIRRAGRRNGQQQAFG